MKLTLLILLVLSNYTQNDWLSKTKREVYRFDKKAVLKKEKSNQEYTIKNYTLKPGIKQVLQLKYNEDTFFNELILSRYVKGDFIFCERTYYQSPIIRKGAGKEGDPTDEIVESICFFKNKTIGIELKKSIGYNSLSNIDSIKKDFKQIPFDTLVIDNSDYLRVEKGYLKTLAEIN